MQLAIYRPRTTNQPAPIGVSPGELRSHESQARRQSSARPTWLAPWMCAGVHDRSVRKLLAWLFTLSAWEYRLLPTAAFAIRARPSLSISVSLQRLLADLGKCRVAYPHRLEDTACIGRCTAPTVVVQVSSGWRFRGPRPVRHAYQPSN
jgi:hypothetical protein